MSKEQIKSEIDSLVVKLKKYQDEYYKLGRPSVPDLEYDRLFDRLKYLEKKYPALKRPDSPTHRVGSDLTQEFPEVNHTIPVLSLDKCYTTVELLKWLNKTQKNAGEEISFILEEKIDGSSIVLYYENGELVRAVTRGNGIIGNDITGNVRTIKSVPLKLTRPVNVAVRGEIFLSGEEFKKINSKMDIPYANPRNFAAGTLRRIKSSDVAKIPLDIFIYEGFFNTGNTGPITSGSFTKSSVTSGSQTPDSEYKYATHFQILNELKELGFKLNNNIGFFSNIDDRSNNHVDDQDNGFVKIDKLKQEHPEWEIGKISDIENFINKENKIRDSLSYDIDGMVLKVNEIDIREKLGYTGHHPRWAVAFKFESPIGKTIVRNIELQIGRTGRVTPVARVDPVRISGSIISNVTLHNQEYINTLELAIGDSVEVSKRGDVIPAVERVLEKNENGYTTWGMPMKCPVCSTPLKLIGAHHFCINYSCTAQQKGRLYFFVSRNQMDIENLGPETIDFLFDNNLIKNVEDIYKFNPDKLIGESGFGEKKVKLIRDGIEKSKKQPFRIVLSSLGIPELGQRTVDLLIEAGFRDIDSLLKFVDIGDTAPFIAIHGMGGKTAGSIIKELSKPEVRSRITSLKEAGLNLHVGLNKYDKLKDYEALDGGEGLEERLGLEPVFKGQTWCVTGSFEEYKPRELAMEEVKKRGGMVTSIVSSRTTHLLVGKGAGGKLKKAESIGIKIVSEEDFLKLF